MDYSHSNDPLYPQKVKTPVPENARLIRNLAMGSNYLMSHILHFYHLVALDYVDVNGTGLIPKGFTCPNYASAYYTRAVDPGGGGSWAYSVNDQTGSLASLGDLTAYLAGQYVRALKFRRMAHQLGALFTGRMPHAQCFTPGCVTTRPYDPNATSGKDAQVRQKVHELLYGGPAFDPDSPGTHPLNSQTITQSNPHPESLLGFIGKPTDFWSWANGSPILSEWPNSGTFTGFDPAALPPWAAAGVPGAHLNAPNKWQPYTGTHLFDVVAAAHLFPEYFWIGTGYGRFLAWGIFEGASAAGGEYDNEWGSGGGYHPDERLITRRRVHIPRSSSAAAAETYTFWDHTADHLMVKEFTKNSWYYEANILKGRHPWKGQTKVDPDKANAYTFAKSPRYLNNESGLGTEQTYHANGDYIPYEVGPLARGMANAAELVTAGGPALLGEVSAVVSGSRYVYYPGIVNHVDNYLTGALDTNYVIGVAPDYGAHPDALAPLAGTVLYVPSGGLPANFFSAGNGGAGSGYKQRYIGDGTLDRIAARALETYHVARNMLSWFNAIDPNDVVNNVKKFRWWKGTRKNKTSPRKAVGAGLTEAPRGALAHWIRIGKKTKAGEIKGYRGKVGNYQIITPTAWNISPKDHNDVMGPIEKSIHGTPLVAEAEPIEILRVIHSFDPCCACTVHVLNPKKEKVAKATLEALI